MDSEDYQDTTDTEISTEAKRLFQKMCEDKAYIHMRLSSDIHETTIALYEQNNIQYSISSVLSTVKDIYNNKLKGVELNEAILIIQILLAELYKQSTRSQRTTQEYEPNSVMYI